MATNFMSFLNINTTLTPSVTAGSLPKNVLLIGQRITDGDLILSTNGFPQPNYYVPFLLPSFQSGTAALNYLSNYGIQSQIGINFSLALPAPDTVTQAGSVTTVSWNTVPPNFASLLGFALTGTLSQLSVNATVRSAQINSGVASLTVNGSPAFVTSGSSGAAMTLSGVNNVAYPDPNNSDPIALMAWDFYQTYLSANNSAQGSPSAYLSILSDRDTTDNANPTSLVFPAPASVTSPSGGLQTLTYPISTSGLGYLPTTSYGNTLVTQDVTLPSQNTSFIYYGNNMFVAGTVSGLYYSTNGLVWTISNISEGVFYSIYYNGTVFVATGSIGLYYSADGITWTVSNINSGTFLWAIFANNIWVATSTVGIYYSTNGTTWTISSGAATGLFNQVAYGAGVFIAACAVDLYSSTDGINWSALSFSTTGFNTVTYSNGLFEVGSDGSGTNGLAYSADGVTFDFSNIRTGLFYQIVFNGNYWVAASSAGLYKSENGIDWVLASGTSAHTFRSVAFANNIWVAMSNAGIYSSPDGNTWTATNINTGTYRSVTFANQLFIGGGTTGIVYSTNGTIWSSNDSSASGVYQGYQINGNNVVITVQNTSGAFTNAAGVDITLDNTISVFDFLDNINLHSAVNQFPVVTSNDINVTQAAFFQGITAINEPNQVLNGHYFTYGFSGNISVLPSSAANLPSPNNQQYVLVTYPYVAKFGDIPYENTAGNVAGGRICSAVAYMLANGDAPYPALTNTTINHLPISSVSSTTSYSSIAGGTGNIAVQQGWLPLAPRAGRVTFLQSNTSLITIPNTTTPDIEFRYTHIWDCVRWLKYQVAQLYNVISVLPNNAGAALLSPAFLTQFRTGIIGILNQGQTLSVIENVEQYQNLVSVIIDPENPNQVDAYIPAQIIPQLNGANITINIFSALYNFTNNQ